MQKVKIIIGELFEAPMGQLNFPQYFQQVNTQGKITARSLMDLCTVLFTYAEEQEARNETYEQNFRNIQEILEKLVNEKKSVNSTVANSPQDQSEPQKGNNGLTCEVCGKVCASELGLRSHKRSHK